MRKVFVVLTALIIAIIGCNERPSKSIALTGVDKLPSQFFNININQDTILKTLKGAFLDIPKGSLSSANSMVQLEIKEAYNLEDIIKAGLITRSNGQPLSSGGMIYINAVAGENIRIVKAIKIAVPAKFLNKKMELFKGEKNDTGLNWNNPVPLTESLLLKKIDEGEMLFKMNCGSCHKVDVDFTGPALANVVERKGKEYAYQYSRFHSTNNTLPVTDEAKYGSYSDSSRSRNDEAYLLSPLLATPDLYYLACLKTAFNAIGPKFPNLTNGELDGLYKYVQNETGRLHVTYPNSNFTSSLDSCEIYYNTVNKLFSRKEVLLKDSVKQKIKDFRPPPGHVPSSRQPLYPDNNVIPEDNNSIYYQFKIDVVGWYNIDALLNSFDNKIYTELKVRVAGNFKASISINLAVPVINTFLEGGKLAGEENEYGFFTRDGKIPLPENAKAYIIAMGEIDGQLVYAKKEFIVSQKQSIEIKPENVTTQEFNESIKAIGATTINISVAETQTGKDLKQIDKELKEAEKLKPKNCSCDCGLLK